MEGTLIIISAPSGAGKTTIVRHLLENEPSLSFSISATTRPLRGCEKEGVDYYFLSQSEFKQKIENNAFVEWQEVYNGCFYGTLKSELERVWNDGKCVLFDVDPKGGINLKNQFGTNSVSIFIMPPSIETLEERLLTRGTDCFEKIKMRVEKAREEVKLAENFDHVIQNNQLEPAKKEALRIVRSFLES